MFFEGMEVAIIVKKRETALDAECADDHVDSGSYRHPPAAKETVVRGSPGGEIRIAEREAA